MKSFDFAASEINRLLFTSVTWPDDISDCSRAFERCTFHELADFTGSGIKGFAAFDAAWFEKGLRLDPLKEQEVKDAFLKELPAKSKKLPSAAREEILGQVESGCRSLKQAMEKVSNRPLEQLFYRLELQARRCQAKTSRAEKLISSIYAHYSDYGASYWRPFYGLATLLASFTVIYGLIAGYVHIPWAQNITSLVNLLAQPEAGQLPQHQETVDSLGNLNSWAITANYDKLDEMIATSASRIFPFGAFEDVSKAFADKLSNGWLRLMYRVLATCQSFMAITLAFMFGLAVRRRFQID